MRTPYRTAPETKTSTRSVSLRCRLSSTSGSGTYPLCLVNQAPDQDTTANISIVDSVTYGADRPGWRQAIARGNDATTSLSGTRRVYRYNPLRTSYNGVKGNPFTQCLRGASSGANVNVFQFASYPASVLDSEADRKAASALLKSYLDARAKFRGGNFAAELVDTVRMFLRPSRLLYKHTWTYVGRLGKLRKVSERDPIRYGQAISKLWLSYVFGVKPLVQDAREFYNALVTVAELGMDNVRIKGTGTTTSPGSKILRAGIPNTKFFEHNIYTFETRSVRYYGAVRARAPGPAAFGEHFGVSFYDVLPAVWEAIPWSFLVDYFVNVNEVIESMKWMDADIAWLNKTWKNTHVVVGGGAMPVPTIPSTDYLLTCSGGDYRVISTRFSRNRSTQVPSTPWQFKLPSAGQTLNIGALTAAFLDTKPKK